MTYYAVRKAGSMGQASAVVTALSPAWEALAAFDTVEEVRRYLLSASVNALTPAYQGRFARRPPRAAAPTVISGTAYSGQWCVVGRKA